MTQNALENLVQLQIALLDTAARFGMKFRDPGGVIMYACLGANGKFIQEYELRLVPKENLACGCTEGGCVCN